MTNVYTRNTLAKFLHMSYDEWLYADLYTMIPSMSSEFCLSFSLKIRHFI